MTKLFRSRVPPSRLSEAQIDHLSSKSHSSPEEIQQWYEYFVYCYPEGFLSEKQFYTYHKQVFAHNGQQKQPSKSIVKQLFRVFDLDNDKKLNFDEFFLFSILTSRGSVEDKLKLTLDLYGKSKGKYLSRRQVQHVLTSTFNLLDIQEPTNNLSQTINTIFTQANLNNLNAQINWNEFRSYVLNDPSLFELLLPIENDVDNVEDEIIYPIIRL